MKNINEFTGKEWAELASLLDGEQKEKTNLLSRFMAEDSHNTINYWKELREMNNEREINVNKAWNKLYSRLNDNGLLTRTTSLKNSILRSTFIKIAAAALVLLSVGSVLVFLNSKGTLSRTITVATADNQKNLHITFPDGSNVFLNRNTKLSYRENFGRHNRNITLSGEAFFEITPDESKPFTVDAGKASVKVVGTSFNVITNNTDYAVEVFVKTGKVILSDNSGAQTIVLDPGFIGTMDSKLSGKSLNNNPNYQSWHTGLLIYDGQKLDVVFRDLKRVYNMEVVADNPEILEKPWTSPIDNMPQETIIRLICSSFNLSYTKAGNIFHLAVK